MSYLLGTGMLRATMHAEGWFTRLPLCLALSVTVLLVGELGQHSDLGGPSPIHVLDSLRKASVMPCLSRFIAGAKACTWSDFVQFVDGRHVVLPVFYWRDVAGVFQGRDAVLQGAF